MLEDAQDMGFNHTVFLTHPINENLMPQHVKLSKGMAMLCST